MCIISVHTPKCNCLYLCVEQHQYYALLAWHTSHCFKLLDQIFRDYSNMLIRPSGMTPSTWKEQIMASFKVLSLYSQGRTEENHENLSQGIQTPRRDLNTGHPGYETEVLITGPRRSLVQFNNEPTHCGMQSYCSEVETQEVVRLWLGRNMHRSQIECRVLAE
jgi:hypothetical protein